MIFNEIYSVYYNTAAKIITEILKGNNVEKAIIEVIAQSAFGESVLNILPSVKNEKWQIIKRDFTTPIKHVPTMPLTALQKQWLKAITLDPRIKLFDIDIKGLEDTEPLFTADDYVIYDKYGDSDPYEDEDYIKNFKTVLKAINSGKNLSIEMMSGKGKRVFSRCIPKKIEYSEKDDKFRLITDGCKFFGTVNMARIEKCRIYEGEVKADIGEYAPKPSQITLRISEERNTLERCMLHFANFEKRAERDDKGYLLYIKYDKYDESEMVIRVLSFGPTVEVTEPESFRSLIKDKLRCQKNCGLI